MAESMNDILHPKNEQDQDPDFPHAPDDWNREVGVRLANEQDVELEQEHWRVIQFLQEYFATNEDLDVRHLSKAIEQQFHTQGGRKHLFQLFPGGPITQGCKIAGLEPPEGSVDKSFGTVQ